ncbi:C-C motif chemokine 6-like [Cricetulus griseus]|uniref:C-C motif chemokine n=1 Tax=Cricetulus griseus TaxID=10029 RepID=A0A9J7KBT2_CRIGR|nr:C-C motif chemokine 6-like [Cricetulus griseus]XP_035317197.1 C-C motif chemokine 6-like [Cricetulus griseus]
MLTLLSALFLPASDTEEVLKAKQGLDEPLVLPMGFAEPLDCCFSYISRIKCSNFVYYFPTSGTCIKPGIIFVTKKRNQVCANPRDQKVQKCIKSLKQIS